MIFREVFVYAHLHAIALRLRFQSVQQLSGILISASNVLIVPPNKS